MTLETGLILASIYVALWCFYLHFKFNYTNARLDMHRKIMQEIVTYLEEHKESINKDNGEQK